jgi:hypothetical protein
MPEIDYGSFTRLLLRCREVAEEPGMKTSVVTVYDAVLKDRATSYLTAADAFTAAETSFAKENKESLAALAELDGPYREARSVMLAIKPETKLPDTLKVQPTDTDKLKAIEDLLDAIDDHVGEDWADKLLQDAFAVKAPQTIKEVNEAIAANKALSQAQEKRAEAYGPAYERYLRFKRVVREALGSKSKQYKRIHLRSAAGGAEGGSGGEGGGQGPTPAPTG